MVTGGGVAQHGRHAWLVIYDIANARRLVRVAKTLERRAIRLQYSVFLGIWTAGACEAVLSAVGSQINPRKDDVRAYRLPAACQAEFFGRRALDGDVVLAQRGLALLELLGVRGTEWLGDQLGSDKSEGLIKKSKA